MILALFHVKFFFPFRFYTKHFRYFYSLRSRD